MVNLSNSPTVTTSVDVSMYRGKSPKAVFIAVPFTMAEKLKQTKCLSTGKWIIKIWYISTMRFYICPMEFYLAVKRNEIMKFASAWMTSETIIMSEVT